jgi:hypothetical protein
MLASLRANTSSDEVLLQVMTVGLPMRAMVSKTWRLTSCSRTRLDHQVRAGDGHVTAHMALHAGQGSVGGFLRQQLFADFQRQAVAQRLHAFGKAGLVDFAQIHLVAVFGKHQGNAGAHDAGTQHSDAAGAGREGLAAQLQIRGGGSERGEMSWRCQQITGLLARQAGDDGFSLA